MATVDGTNRLPHRGIQVFLSHSEFHFQLPDLLVEFFDQFCVGFIPLLSSIGEAFRHAFQGHLLPATDLKWDGPDTHCRVPPRSSLLESLPVLLSP